MCACGVLWKWERTVVRLGSVGFVLGSVVGWGFLLDLDRVEWLAAKPGAAYRWERWPGICICHGRYPWSIYLFRCPFDTLEA